jgi:membrane protease YdiL (CAAX protease family)
MLGVLAGSTILISELDNIVINFYPMPADLMAPMVERATGTRGWISTIFLLNIVAPVTEELLFRGVILRGFLGVYPTRKAILLSAFLFAFFHLNPWQAISAFPLGVVFGWWYTQSRSVLPCIIGHSLFNAIPVVLFSIVGMEHPDLSAPVEFQPLWLDALGGLLLLGSGYTLEGLFRAAMPVPVDQWTSVIRRFGGRLLQHARDDYGDPTPLFVSQIDVQTQTLPSPDSTLYVAGTRGGAGPTSNNLQFDGGLLRLLYGLSDTSVDLAYQEAADDYLAHYLERLPLPSGYFPWGDHRGFDVVEDDVIDGHGEFKVAMPVWDRMWSIDPEAVVRQAEALRKHIIDPTRSLAFSRHYPPGDTPHCMNASAGAWIALWTFTYTQTGDAQYLDWGTEMADYLWSLRNPNTDLLAAHPYDPAYPDVSNQARQRASRTEYMGPMYWYAVNLLRSHQMLSSQEDSPYKQQALAYIRAFTRRFDVNEDGHFYATFNLETGDPLFDRITRGWQITPQARDDEPTSGVVGLRAPISLAYAYLVTHEPDLKEAFDRFQPLFRIESFFDLDAPRQSISAGLLAQVIGAWTNLYAATSEYAYLATAAALGRYAAHHYIVDDWFVCGPPTVPRYRDDTLTGWETYSNRGGSADLALALLRLSAIADGRDELIEHDPLCYF